MKIKFLGLMLLAVVMVFALASCKPTPTPTEPAGNTYTITFEGADVAAITVAENTAATAPAAPTKAGYTFAGWTYAGEAWDWENIVVGDMTLTASWTAIEYALTLNLDGGTLAAPVATYTVEGLTLPTPTQEGYLFAGWVDGEGNVVTAIAPGTTGALSLTATWTLLPDVMISFEAGQQLHYAEGNDDAVALEFGQTYKPGTATGGANGYMHDVYQSHLTFPPSQRLEFMKNEKNWHFIATENGNNFVRTVLDSTMATKYAKVTANEAYNVGWLFYTQDQQISEENNVYTVSVDFRMKNEGAFGINFYVRGTGNHQKSDSREALFTIMGNGDIMINADTVKDNRNCYYDGSAYLPATKVGAIEIGEWNTLTAVMVEVEDGFQVMLMCGEEVLTEEPLFLYDNAHKWSDGTFTMLMIFGGTGAGQTAVEALGTYYNEYDIDNVIITGSKVDVE